ncbi:reverse transcriptase-like protein [Herminiimonas aquatilis]|uniref:Reverse transcriptase-like protein n=1 Tax=Herminiimonas aquatilis TaxID=345342 RepID=A0ABW2J6B1_9BURK
MPAIQPLPYMPSYADLIEVAYKKERVSGRRMARQLGISEEHGLKKVMEKIAGAQPLHIFIDQRRQEAADAAAKIVTRKQEKANARIAATAMPDPNAWLAWFDGASHPNPGRMGIGGLLKNPQGELVASISFSAGQGDSSEAEYLALLAVLQAAVDASPHKLIVYGDSRVVLDDVQSKTRGAPILSSHRTHARQLMAQLHDVRFIWIPRRKNDVADALSQQAVILPSSYVPP